MKFFNLFTLLSLIAVVALTNATSPAICGYTNIKGEFRGLNYFPGINKGQEYVDYGYNTDKVCVQRATCGDNINYKTIIDKCSDFKVDCSSRNNFEGEFPACCAKC